MQFYLAAGIGDTLPRGRFRPVRAAYRLGPRLLSAVGNAPVQGGLMLVGDSRECGSSDVAATVLIPNSLHARRMRKAISPRLAIRTLSNIVNS